MNIYTYRQCTLYHNLGLVLNFHMVNDKQPISFTVIILCEVWEVISIVYYPIFNLKLIYKNLCVDVCYF